MTPQAPDSELTSEKLLSRTILGVSGVFLALGVGLGHSAAASLALFICVLPFLFTAMCRESVSSLVLTRRMASAQYENQEMPVEILLRNNSQFPLFLPEVRDLFSAERQQYRWAVHPGWIEPDESLRVRYVARTSSGRGEYTIGPVWVRVTDPLGLVSTGRAIEETSSLTVFPTVARIERLPLESNQIRFSTLLRSTAKTAAGQDFYGVREYRRGDSRRRIHWLSSARRQKLIVKEFEMPSSRTVHVFADFFEGTGRGMGQRSTADRVVRVTASICDYAIRSHHAAGLVADTQIRIRLDPRGGHVQLTRIMRALVTARPKGATPFDRLLLEHLPSILLDSAVVLVFPTSIVDPEQYRRAAAVILGRRCRIMAVLIDDRAYYRMTGDAGDYGEDRSPEQMAGLLRAMGISVFVADDRTPLERVFAQAGR